MSLIDFPKPTVGHVGDDDVPWVDAGDGIELKVLRIDLENGLWAVRNRFAAGVQLPRHRHTGGVHGFTLSGAWKYLEYDFVNRAGSFLREPAGSVHTLKVPDDNIEPTDVVFIIEGANLDLGLDDSVVSIVDASVVLEGYYALCEAQGLPRANGILT